MKRIKKLIITSLLAITAILSLSICASADVQIEGLSVIDNVIYAQLSGEDVKISTLYAAAYNEGVLVDVFFAKADASNSVSLPLGNASEYKLYLWDKSTLAPCSYVYTLKNGKAYSHGSNTPVPEYESNSYVFNQDSSVMIVSSINENQISGFVDGVSVTYPLSADISVCGLSDKLDDVVPGCIVMPALNSVKECGIIELLASIGLPVNQTVFESSFGVYTPSDGSTRYKNIVTELYSKSSTLIRTCNYPDTTKTSYIFKNAFVPCYRIGIATEDGTPVITTTKKNITSYPSIFEKTNEYHNYLYLRYDTSMSLPIKINNNTYVDSDGVVVECVYFCVPKDYDYTKGDDEYTGIFSAGKQIIIE